MFFVLFVVEINLRLGAFATCRFLPNGYSVLLNNRVAATMEIRVNSPK